LDPETRPDLDVEHSNYIWERIKNAEDSDPAGFTTIHAWMCELNRCGVGNAVLNNYLEAYHYADFNSVVGAQGEA